jgi:hypothetical protein
MAGWKADGQSDVKRHCNCWLERPVRQLWIIDVGRAYRTGNLTVWGRLAILGGLSVLLSAILADIAVTRLMG